MTGRVWDPFLTEQDRRTLASLPPRGETVGASPALLLIDVYRAAFGDEPLPVLESVRRWPASCGLAAWDALPHITGLLAAAREAGLPVIHVTGYDVSQTGIERWSKRPGTPRRDGGFAAAGTGAGRGYEFMPGVAPAAGEAVVRKVTPSAFCCTALVPHLISTGADTVILAGETTSGCVRATAVDARSYGFRVILAEECVFDRHEAAHAMNLFDIHQKYGSVLPVAEVLSAVRTVHAIDQDHDQR
ncbi:MAG TPA: isochorismatase family protein [Streptosporangiaceae bacterium]|jgi:nicotinamidase-related amidase